MCEMALRARLIRLSTNIFDLLGFSLSFQICLLFTPVIKMLVTAICRQKCIFEIGKKTKERESFKEMGLSADTEK